MATVVLSLAGGALWWALRPAGRSGPGASRTPQGYYLLFPDQLSATSDPNGGTDVVLSTNLPEGTVAQLQYQSVGSNGGSGYQCCIAVHDGTLALTVTNSSCILPPGAEGSSGFEITVTVRPAFDNVVIEGPAPPGGVRTPPSQPADVLAILGDRFENLIGDQVTNDGTVNQFVVVRTYDWPADSCAGWRAAMIPETCDAQHGEGPISEDHSAQSVPAQVVGMLLQSRLCDLWTTATPDFQAAHPWPDFKTQWDQWLQGLGPISDETGQHSRLSAKVVEVSEETFEAGSNGLTFPERIVADYYLDDRKVAQVEFVRVGPVQQGLVPSFEFSRFEIIEG